MKMAVIGSEFDGMLTACRWASKRHEGPLFEKNTVRARKISGSSRKGYRFVVQRKTSDTNATVFICGAKIMVNEIPVY